MLHVLYMHVHMHTDDHFSFRTEGEYTIVIKFVLSTQINWTSPVDTWVVYTQEGCPWPIIGQHSHSGLCSMHNGLHCCTEVPLQATFSNMIKKCGSGLGWRLHPSLQPSPIFYNSIKYNIQYQDGSHEGSSVGRGNNTKARKEQRKKGHTEDLSSTSHTYR